MPVPTHKDDGVGLSVLLDRSRPGRTTLRVSRGPMGPHGDASQSDFVSVLEDSADFGRIPTLSARSGIVDPTGDGHRILTDRHHRCPAEFLDGARDPPHGPSGRGSTG